MGKHSEIIAWSDIEAAIKENPNNRVAVIEGQASAAIMAVPEEVELPWLPGWHEESSFVVSDIISLVLWITEPMYRTAAESTRRTMEREEAANLILAIEKAWAENGKQHGWIRKHLEEDLRLRAGGGDPMNNVWDSVKTVKRSAQLVDYVCMHRKIRLALWFSDSVTSIPLTGLESPVYQLNCVSGRLLIGPDGLGLKGALSTAKEWLAPLCAPSIGSHTVAQIQERLQTFTPEFVKGNRVQLWNRLMYETMKAEGKNLTPYSPP